MVVLGVVFVVVFLVVFGVIFDFAFVVVIVVYPSLKKYEKNWTFPKVEQTARSTKTHTNTAAWVKNIIRRERHVDDISRPGKVITT